MEGKLSHISHRYTLVDNEFEVLSAKFSPDSSFIAVSYGDCSMSIYSSMLGDPMYYLKDDDIEYPITGISWKPLQSGSESKHESEVQSLKAVSADGRIFTWRPKFSNNIKTVLVSEVNSY